MKTDKILNYLFYFSVLVFFVGFNFSDNPPNGWYLQTIEGLDGRGISDVFFLDSVNGWAVTGYRNYYDTAFILKTTNGGDNWIITDSNNQTSVGYNKVVFLNEYTGFVCGKAGILRKTTDSGYNWNQINIPVPYVEYFSMSVLNEDTIWLVSSSTLTGGVFRTTNGGQSWIQQLSAGNQNPEMIYMYNARIGFIGSYTSNNLRKTTNGGFNWFTVLNEGLTDIYFIDSLTGWKCWNELDSIKMTTNGGINWNKVLLPPTGGFYSLSVIRKLSVINNNIIYGVGARANTINGFRGLIYKTTNGGINWGYQLPDINQINITRYWHLKFLNYYTGWAYQFSSGVHTTIGGDTTIYTGIQNNLISEIPKEFELKQNYPNPFNSMTNVKFKMLNSGFVEIKVYDISGKMLKIITNKKYNAGEYVVRFDAGDLPSGIYFYSLIVDGKVVDTKKATLIK